MAHDLRSGQHVAKLCTPPELRAREVGDEAAAPAQHAGARTTCCQQALFEEVLAVPTEAMDLGGPRLLVQSRLGRGLCRLPGQRRRWRSPEEFTSPSWGPSMLCDIVIMNAALRALTLEALSDTERRKRNTGTPSWRAGVLQRRRPALWRMRSPRVGGLGEGGAEVLAHRRRHLAPQAAALAAGPAEMHPRVDARVVLLLQGLRTSAARGGMAQETHAS